MRDPAEKLRIRLALMDDEMMATPLVALLIDNYGTGALGWDPQTIVLELQDDFGARIPLENQHRLMAGVTLLTTDLFYSSLPDFITLCNVLSGDLYDPRTWDPADLLEVAWGVTEAGLLAPPDPEDGERFHPEILGYIGALLEMEGIINPPEALKIGVPIVGPEQPYGQLDFSDDPAEFAGLYDLSQAKRDRIDQHVAERLQQLAEQLDRLPLYSAEGLSPVEALKKQLSQKRRSSTHGRSDQVSAGGP